MPDTVIAVENLSKRYLIGAAERRHETLAGSLAAALTAPIRNMRNLARLDASHIAGDAPDTFWALDGVSFEVRRGEVLGVVGRNGAGKSTLLKVLSRITEPTSGRVGIKGRIASLLEVGTGFHPELTGRDNVYMNGTLLGMTRREIDRKFDEIVAFAGMERFLDTPVKRYSSGMQVRLAFAVAAHLDPEILIVDEVLAVGDYEFQAKCLGKMEEVARGGDGRTILFVSHNMGMVRSLCSRCLLLRSGRLAAEGPPEAIIEAYEQHQVGEGRDGTFRQPPDDRYALQVLEAALLDDEGRPTSAIDQFSPLSLRLRYAVRRPLVGSNLGVWVNHRGTRLFTTFDTDEHPELLRKRHRGQYEAMIPLPTEMLKAGRYTVGLNSGIINSVKRPDHQYFEDLLEFEVREVFATSLKGYAPQRAGLLALRLDWETHRRDMAMGGRASSLASLAPVDSGQWTVVSGQ
jgi:lipopolysaccharide transport system ATP-binding protein